MKINEFIIYTKKDFSNEKFAIISDIHISDNIDLNKLSQIINNLYIVNPDYILIAGDLYNADCNDIEITKKITINFLQSLSKICKVYISLGKHELEPLLNKKINDSDIHNKKAANSALLLMNSIFKLESNTKLYKLRNNINFVGQFTSHNVINNDNFTITGLNFDYNFYHHNNDNIFPYEYKDYIIKQTEKLNNNDFNILLCHEPIIIDYFHTIPELKKYDLIISSHNHGNLNSLIYNALLKNNDKLNNKYAHGLIIKNNTPFIISKGITKFHSAEGYLQRLEKNNEGNIELVKIRRKS